MCYEAKVCVIMLSDDMLFNQNQFLQFLAENHGLKSMVSIKSSFRTYNSTLEGATEMKFVDKVANTLQYTYMYAYQQ